MNIKLSYKIKIIIAGFMLVFVCGSAFSQTGLSKKLTEGNKLYADGEYDKALTKYNDAQIESPTRPEIFFNMGNVFYRQGKYKEAADSYQKSTEKGDIGTEAKAMYNTGNALFQQGQLREALEYYKQALERKPDDIDTKYNIEYTERVIKEMLSKSQETEEKAMEEQQKREMQEQQSSQSGGDSKEDGESNEEQTQTASMQGEESGKEEKSGARQAEEDKEKNDGPQEQEARVNEADTGDKDDLSEEEAERFLSAFERDRKDNSLLNQRKSRKGQGYYVEKDW